MGEAGAVEIVFPGPEDLGFVLEAAEGGGVEDAVSIDLEGGAVVRSIRGAGEAFGIEAAVEFVPHVAGVWRCGARSFKEEFAGRQVAFVGLCLPLALLGWKSRCGKRRGWQ